MATLNENIKQAISDFDGVQAALEESGVEVPYGTDTSEYGNLVRQAVALAHGNGMDEDRVREIVEEYLTENPPEAGQDGKDGKDGKDGITPTIEISEDGYWVINGIKSDCKAVGQDGEDGQDGADGKNGQDGKDGIDGKNGIDGIDGKDGFSPTVEVTQISGGHRVDITDLNGVKSFDVKDGKDASVDTTQFATKAEVAVKADDILFPDNYVVGIKYGAFNVGDSLQNLTLREIIMKMLDAKEASEPESIIDKIISNEIPMLSGSEDGVTATNFAYIELTAEEAANAPTTSGFYQIVNDGVVSENGYQLITESTGRTNYAIALPEGSTLVDVMMWDEPTSAWVDYSPVFTKTGTTTVDGYSYIIYTSADSSSGETLRFIIE